MSKITTDDVRQLAQLSSLQMSDSEIESIAADIENILNYISQLNELDTTGVEPTYQVTGLENVWRGDEVDGGDMPLEQLLALTAHRRSEERRVGKECRSRWSPYH